MVLIVCILFLLSKLLGHELQKLIVSNLRIIYEGSQSR